MGTNNRIRITRRRLLVLALLGSAATLVPAGALAMDPDTRQELEQVVKRVSQHHGEEAAEETAEMEPFLVQSRDEIESPPHVPFVTDLPLPPVQPPDGPAVSREGIPAEHYTLIHRVGSKEYFPNRPGFRTPIWGYSSQVTGFEAAAPGPTIINQLDTPSVAKFVNELPAPVIPHHHGGHQGHEDDGFASDKIDPGAARDFHYPNTNTQNASAPNWYHDHRQEVTSQHVFLGLAGFMPLNDKFEDDLRAAGILPKGFAGDTTGRMRVGKVPHPVLTREQAHDIPLVIQDRTFFSDGRLFKQVDPGDKGQNGDTWLVNGAIRPKFEVARRKYRFRLLNGAPARDWHVALSVGHPARGLGRLTFVQIGTDGGLMSRAVERSTILMGIAERFEVIIDFKEVPLGSQVFLVNLFGNELWKEDEPIPIMRFDVVRDEPEDTPVDVRSLRELRPRPLRGFPSESEAVRRREFVFERQGGLWVINGRTWDKDRDDAVIPADTVEIWDLVNKSGGWVHPIHIHEEDFHITRHGKTGDMPPAPDYESLGLKDTVRLGFNDSARVVKFFSGEFAGPRRSQEGRFVFHCHVTDHEDHHMMGVLHIVK